MDKVLRPVHFDADQLAGYLSLVKLTDDDKELIKSLGLPGTDKLFDEDPDTARAARRQFARSFLEGTL